MFSFSLLSLAAQAVEEEYHKYPKVKVLSKKNEESLKSDPSGDCVIPHVEVRVRAQASYGNITVLSHLKSKKIVCFYILATFCGI